MQNYKHASIGNVRKLSPYRVHHTAHRVSGKKLCDPGRHGSRAASDRVANSMDKFKAGTQALTSRARLARRCEPRRVASSLSWIRSTSPDALFTSTTVKGWSARTSI